jgi:hypothetical protein
MDSLALMSPLSLFSFLFFSLAPSASLPGDDDGRSLVGGEPLMSLDARPPAARPWSVNTYCVFCIDVYIYIHIYMRVTR